jgi:hypothetical protein
MVRGWEVISTLDFTAKKELPVYVPVGCEYKGIEPVTKTSNNNNHNNNHNNSTKSEISLENSPEFENNPDNSSGFHHNPENPSQTHQPFYNKFRLTPTLSQIIAPNSDPYGVSLFPVQDPNYPSNNRSGRIINETPVLIPSKPQHFGFFSSLPTIELEALHAALDPSSYIRDIDNNWEKSDFEGFETFQGPEYVRELESNLKFFQNVHENEKITKDNRPNFPILGTQHYQSYYLHSAHQVSPKSTSGAGFLDIVSDSNGVNPHSVNSIETSLRPLPLSHFDIDPVAIARIIEDDLSEIMRIDDHKDGLILFPALDQDHNNPFMLNTNATSTRLSAMEFFDLSSDIFKPK